VTEDQRKRTGGYMINFDSNMEMYDPRKGFVLSTDDPEPLATTLTTDEEEEKKEV